MFEMSVNEVPGWSVTMPPRFIGVPVAATPGLVPHDEVLTVPVPVVLDDADADADEVAPELGLDVELVVELELHPARTPPTARIEASAAASRHLRGWGCSIIHCLLVATAKDDSERPGQLSRLRPLARICLRFLVRVPPAGRSQ